MMSNDKQLFLLIGCFGRRDEDFISCSTTENKLLAIEDHLIHYNEMMDYFDQCHLFDKQMFDLSSIRHFIFNLRQKFDQPNRRLWSEKRFNLYEKYLIEHRMCGLYVKLVLAPVIDIEPEFEEKGVFIPAEKEPPIVPVKNKFKLLVNR